eukprot:GHRQ01033253.1.p1 GENE.GHRQ01033253.1~~GHRQ01033253.1.p1  ORF type:complete len:160 (+),score=50.83 GHRQ01033253.1:167-646(+)
MEGHCLWQTACASALPLKHGSGAALSRQPGAHHTRSSNAVCFAAVSHAAGVLDAAVVEHRWGCELHEVLAEPFDVIVACDVMYIDELVPDLVQSLLLLSHQGSIILIAHGRNRPAEPAFKLAAAQHFEVGLVPGDELDEVYQCSDVDVLRLRRLPVKKV